LFLNVRKQTFLDTYANLILPSNGPKLWQEVDTPPVLPPTLRRAPRRPKKLRRKDNDEPKSNSSKGKKNQEVVRCIRCKGLDITRGLVGERQLLIGQFHLEGTR